MIVSSEGFYNFLKNNGKIKIKLNNYVSNETIKKKYVSLRTPHKVAVA